MISFTRIFQFTKHSNIRALSSSFTKEYMIPNRIWSNFLLKNLKDGGLVRLRVQTVPKERFEDFIDLKMNHFVKEEITYKVSGINENSEAIKECREILSNMMSHPSVHTHVYLIDDESKTKPELVAASSMKLITKSDPPEKTKIRTKEMKRFFEIENEWTKLYTFDEVFKRYGVDRLYQDDGLVTHPKYRLLGVAKYDTLVRRLVCSVHDVPVTGAWCTMIGSQRACNLDDWDTLFEMPYEELGHRLGIDFKDPTPSCKYMALKVF